MEFVNSKGENVCPFCQKVVDPERDFKGLKSKQEFKISGLCQKCQDDFFGEDEFTKFPLPGDYLKKEEGQMTQIILDEKTMTVEIVINKSTGFTYRIDLARCTKSSQLIDWMFQIQGKNWCTPEIIFDLMTFFNDLMGKVQNKMCPCGEDKPIDWAEVLAEYHERKSLKFKNLL